jgi:hypothetical protein
MSDPSPSARCSPTEDGWICHVSAADGGGEHEVTLDRATLDDLAPGATPEALVEASFRFLLEREPPEAILRRFELPIIARYFADYPDEIRRRMRPPPAPR